MIVTLCSGQNPKTILAIIDPKVKKKKFAMKYVQLSQNIEPKA